ncbi:MAG: uL15 family ribosomal protein [Candidatus Pacebacteria bacterium]|nr:uL15 family ribosomal protein [Candidatus Paceibacterota bacterium]
MQLHELKSINKKMVKKRIGRGGKKGTYSGKGIKGQSSRAGRKFQPLIRLVIKRYPKKRGYRFKSIIDKPEIINVGILNKNFEEKQEINPNILLEMKLIRKIKGKAPKVKILGNGKITKAFIIKDCEVSKTAKQKIEKLGGTIK